MKKTILAVLAVAMLALSACGSEQGGGESASASDFRIGMASADITPEGAVYLEGYVGHNEQGYSTPDLFESDLKARILVVDNGADRLVFINVEQVFSGWEFGNHTMSEGLVGKIAKTCQTSTANVLLSNTHTHQSYMTLGEKAENNIAAAVAEAYDNLAPAKIGSGSATTKFGASRGNNYTLNLSNPYDGTMNIIRFDNAETGEPIGLIYSVPMHNTLFSNGPGIGGNTNRLCCEFTGYASRAIEESMKEKAENFVAMHINGFYGNATGTAGGQYYAKDIDELKEFGQMFADEILAVYDGISGDSLGGDIVVNKIETTIPGNKTDKTYMQNFGSYDDIPACIKLGAFGDIAYIGVNFEPFSVIATRLKAEAPYSLVLPAANINGWNGYIPTKETFEANKTVAEAECGAYKSPFDEDAEEIFYSKIFEALCDLKNVTAARTDAAFGGVDTAAKAAVYNFTFAAPAKSDKLVLSFGQTLRTDCASEFDVVAYNANGETLLRKTYSGSGDNYVGMFTDGAEISKVSVMVRERYNCGTAGIDTIPMTLHAVSFTSK